MSDGPNSSPKLTRIARIRQAAEATNEAEPSGDSNVKLPSRNRRSFTLADDRERPAASDDDKDAQLHLNDSQRMSTDETNSPSTRKIAAIKAHRLGARSGSGTKLPPPTTHPHPLPVIEYVKLEGDRKVIKAATLSQLIQEYSENSPDAESLQHLAVAHGHFISSVDLLKAIISEYKAIEVTAQSTNFQKQYRIINILKTWLAIDRSCLATAVEFTETLNAFVQHLNDVSPSIGSYFSSTIELRNNSGLPLSAVVDSIQLGSAALSSKFSNTLPRLSDFNEQEIAKQLCLIDQALLRKIPIAEFNKVRWTKNEAPRIEMSGLFANKVAYWLSLQIVAEAKMKDQLKLWAHVVQIGKHLLQLQNFNSLLAVYLALQNKQIKQMQVEWGSKTKKSLQALKQIESVMNPLNNFAAYRAYTKELHYPLIPCVEIFLKDLLYQAEGSPDFADEEGSYVLNVLKLDSMGRLIMQVVNSQNTLYEFDHNEALGALFASFMNRGVGDIKEELDNCIDTADWNEYLSLSKKDIEALVGAHGSPDDDEGSDKEKKVKDKRERVDKKSRESKDPKDSKDMDYREMKELLAMKDAEIATLKVHIADLEAEVKRLKKGKID